MYATQSPFWFQFDVYAAEMQFEAIRECEEKANPCERRCPSGEV